MESYKLVENITLNIQFCWKYLAGGNCFAESAHAAESSEAASGLIVPQRLNLPKGAKWNRLDVLPEIRGTISWLEKRTQVNADSAVGGFVAFKKDHKGRE